MTKVKICGLSTPETMRAAVEAGADFVGLMFFAKSPRYVSLERAAVLAELARGRAKIAVVTVDADDPLLTAIAAQVKPDYIQAHGAETPERLAQMTALTRLPVYRVVRVSDAAQVAEARRFGQGPFVMFDAAPPAGAMLPGGNGHAFDWTILKDANHPFMLAGGLSPENVGEAIRVTGADMVDVSSGVESAPGVKDAVKIRNFIEAAKATA
jgi:phosphoribosylanthranilate isomerase